MSRIFICGICLLLCSCLAPSVFVEESPRVVQLQSRPLYIVPFETVMVPEEVAAGLFDLFVDQLNQQGEEAGLEYVILKQELAQIDSDWLAQHNYLTGEIYAYIEEVGSAMTVIKARSRIQLYQPGQPEPALLLSYPSESFYQNDYSSLPDERRKIVEDIATNLADQFSAAVIGPR